MLFYFTGYVAFHQSSTAIRAMIDRTLRSILRPFLQWSLPQTRGHLITEGLEDPVEIYRDSAGIPHLFAHSERDLFFAMGFATAQDRFWQMELTRRFFRGEMAAAFGAMTLRGSDLPVFLRGKTLVDLDHFIRCVGIREAAIGSWAAHSPETQEDLRAYAQGVNRCLKETRGVPLELRLPRIRYTPAAWSAEDGLILLKGVAFFMDHSWRLTLCMDRLERAIPKALDKAEYLRPRCPEGTDTVGGTPVDLLQMDRLIRAVMGWQGLGSGSNNWVVSPRKTERGLAILCNDPHMVLQAPGMLYPCHMECPSFAAAGVSIPGIPGILMGHNRHIAWGVTDAFGHCSDLYRETYHPHDPGLVKAGDGWEEMKREPCLIEVRRDRTLAKNLRRTRNGPLFTDAIGSVSPLALRWTGHEASRDFDALTKLLKAKDLDSFRRSVSFLGTPSLNLVYADEAGNIAYQLAGLYPKRTEGNVGILDGADDRLQWKGFIRFEELPFFENPPCGHIETANNRVVSQGYPYVLSEVYEPAFRVMRIRQALETQETWSLQDLQSLQMDTLSLQGLSLVEGFFKPFQERIDDLPVPAREILGLIAGWQGECDTGSIGASAFHVFFWQFSLGLLSRWFGPEETDLYLELIGLPHLPLGTLLCDVPNAYLSSHERDALVIECLVSSHQYLVKRLGPSPDLWQWGKIHQAIHSHPFGRVPLWGRLWDIGPDPSPGSPVTVNRGEFLLSAPFSQRLGPCARLIMVPGDWDQSLLMCNAGVSGHVASEHYDDMTKMWLQGRYVPLLFSSQEIQKGPCLRLIPERQTLGKGDGS